MPEKLINTDGIYLTFRAAAKLSGIEERTIRGYRSQQVAGLPFYKIKGRVYVKRNEFLRFLELIAVVKNGVEASVERLRLRRNPCTEGARKAPDASTASFILRSPVRRRHQPAATG